MVFQHIKCDLKEDDNKLFNIICSGKDKKKTVQLAEKRNQIRYQEKSEAFFKCNRWQNNGKGNLGNIQVQRFVVSSANIYQSLPKEYQIHSVLKKKKGSKTSFDVLAFFSTPAAAILLQAFGKSQVVSSNLKIYFIYSSNLAHFSHQKSM